MKIKMAADVDSTGLFFIDVDTPISDDLWNRLQKNVDLSGTIIFPQKEGIYEGRYEGEMVLRNQTTISDECWKELQKWVDDYYVYIPMSVDERRARQSEIEEMDKRGIELLKKIRQQWLLPDDIELVYYSEGFMKFINVK